MTPVKSPEPMIVNFPNTGELEMNFEARQPATFRLPIPN